MGHKSSVNSLDIYNPEKSSDNGYLGQTYQQLLLSASDDGTAMIWDLRTNKRVMLIQDQQTTEGREIIKAKFFDSGNYIMTAFGDSLATFDVRKPAIILTKSFLTHSQPHKSEEDFNDFDFCHTSTG